LADRSNIGLGLFSLLSNIVLTLVKGFAGIVGNSSALIADAVESFMDIFSSFFMVIGMRYAAKPADDNHPYGHGKIELLITFCIVLMLFISATWIAFDAIWNFYDPQEAPALWTLWVTMGIIAWKELVFRVIIYNAHQKNNAMLRAEAWHQRSDAISSLAALVGIGAAVFLGKGFEIADECAALFASGIILFNAWRIFRSALGDFMDEQIHDDILQRIMEVSETVEGVENLEKCRIRKVGSTYVVDLHARVDGSLTVTRGHEIAHRLKDQLCGNIPELHLVNIHVEPCTINA
jgi:cation diffusion facilitator family transporter